MKEMLKVIATILLTMGLVYCIIGFGGSIVIYVSLGYTLYTVVASVMGVIFLMAVIFGYCYIWRKK